MRLDLCPENCGYRGEGNAALVIYLKKEEKVLRLLKQDVGCQTVINTDEQKKNLAGQIAMVKNVMKPLLGENLVNCPVVGFLQSEDIKMLNELFSSHRPEFRIHKCVKEEDCFVLILPDYCSLPPDLKVYPSSGPVISIEIKPKQGYLSKEEFLPYVLPSSPLLKCRFCMTQDYKLKQHVIKNKSAYCPTDLYSGCPERMKHALKMLLLSPQNNLRIFKEKELIYSEEGLQDLEELSDFFQEMVHRDIVNFEEKYNINTVFNSNYSDVLCDLIVKILSKPFPGNMHEGLKLLPRESLQDCLNVYPSCTEDGLCHELPKGCVLYRLLCMQMLDKLHIQDLFEQYCKLIESENGLDKFSLVEIPQHLGEAQKKENESEHEYASRKLWEFLTSLIAKDCSIMLVLKNYTGSWDANKSQNLVSDEHGNLYIFSIAIADLDSKAVNKVEKHYKETPLLLQACFSQPV